MEFDWKLGVAVASSECQNLNVPFIRVTVKVEDANLKIHSHTFEMSIPEFKVFFVVYFFFFLFLFFVKFS